MRHDVTGTLLYVVWLGFCFWLGATACRCQPLPFPVPPDPVIDAGTGGTQGTGGSPADSGAEPKWDDGQPCSSAAARLSWLDCIPLRPDSGTWVQACELDRANGLTFGVGCVRGVRTRGDVATCGVTCL